MSELGPRREALVITICCTSALLAAMDVSIVNSALPAIQRDLAASVSGLQWTVDAYTLVLAAFLVLAGSTADRVGRRHVFSVGLVVFGIGSLICSLAPSIAWLVAGRVVQGVGGTMLTPVALAIIVSTVADEASRARAIGVFASIGGVALGLGPIVGGLLVDLVGWRFVFVINVPIVIAAVVLTVLLVPDSQAPRARRFDPVGQLLVVVVLAGTIGAIIESRRLGWTSPVIVVLVAAAAISAVGLIAYEARRADPLLDVRLFRSVPFSSAIVTGLFTMGAFSAFLFVATLYLQVARGMSALTAGLSMLPLGVLTVLLAPVAGWIVSVRGCRLPFVVSATALIAGGGLAMTFTPRTDLVVVLVVTGLFGVAPSLVYPAVSDTAVAGMPHSMAGVATSLTAASRHTGVALGVAVAGVILGPFSGGDAFTRAAHGVWWMVIGLGVGVLVLGLVSTGRWAQDTAHRAGLRFDEVEHGAPAAGKPAGASHR